MESLELLACRPRKQRSKDYTTKCCVAWRAMKHFFHELFDFGLGMYGPALLMFADGVSSDFINNWKSYAIIFVVYALKNALYHFVFEPSDK